MMCLGAAGQSFHEPPSNPLSWLKNPHGGVSDIWSLDWSVDDYYLVPLRLLKTTMALAVNASNSFSNRDGTIPSQFEIPHIVQNCDP